MQQRHTPPEQQPEGDDQDLLTPDLPKEMKPIQTKPRQVGVHFILTSRHTPPSASLDVTVLVDDVVVRFVRDPNVVDAAIDSRRQGWDREARLSRESRAG